MVAEASLANILNAERNSYRRDESIDFTMICNFFFFSLCSMFLHSYTMSSQNNALISNFSNFSGVK